MNTIKIITDVEELKKCCINNNYYALFLKVNFIITKSSSY